MSHSSCLNISSSSSSSSGLSHLGTDCDIHGNVIGHKIDLNDMSTSPCENLRSDNGTEFVNKQFNNFCESNGINHQTYCAYTPEQNRIAERKHRYLLNVARLPSVVLSTRSPYELIYSNTKDDGTKSSFGSIGEPETNPSDAEGYADQYAFTKDVDPTSDDNKYESKDEDFENFGQLFGSYELHPR
ncbi:ribonuclease H-like domain-containing protein [Tanacetum coccineum]